jgi:hypothetical protein
MNNKSDSINQTESDFSFCSDPRINEHIKEHGSQVTNVDPVRLFWSPTIIYVI